jgi:hypothetical protein
MVETTLLTIGLPAEMSFDATIRVGEHSHLGQPSRGGLGKPISRSNLPFASSYHRAFALNHWSQGCWNLGLLPVPIFFRK